MSDPMIVTETHLTPEQFIEQIQAAGPALPEGWDQLTQTQQANYEMASRLRGLAALVESCDKLVRLRVGGRLRWNDGSSFESPVKDFRVFSLALTLFVLDQQLETLHQTDSPDSAYLITLYEQLRTRMAASE